MTRSPTPRSWDGDGKDAGWVVAESVSGRSDHGTAEQIGKVAAARELVECVFYALRDGHVRRLDTSADAGAAPQAAAA
jgi:hypothetical protein